MNKSYKYFLIFLIVLGLLQVIRFSIPVDEDLAVNSFLIFGFNPGNLNTSFLNLIICSFFTYCLFFYIVFIFYAGHHLSRLKLLLTLFFSGMSSNILERVFHNYTLDPISISFGPIIISFNVNDVFILSSFVFILLYLLKNKSAFISKKDLRFSPFVFKNDQLHFSFLLTLFSFFNILALSIFILSYSRNLVEKSSLEFSKGFIIPYILFTFGLLVLTFIASIFISQRFLGKFKGLIRLLSDYPKLDRTKKIDLNDYTRPEDSKIQIIDEIYNKIKTINSEKDD